ncbi:lactate utilization protein C [Sporosarcina sp. P21c]|uniref:LutC/YkgG family protein n=1 Tax=Sporosarcina TaxID=1569 RepID=UPI000A163EDC|nr:MULTISPECIES: lactate utilization protein C [Sporosarcina]ARJ38538.1 lactate utilization protein C [Sporosarcina ureae]PIC67365.1 lactate utilization protein C [Sporosarcina sp. P16a]PIC83185.1 lactate utilization protein C [Sporosarcina sp. P1]PIC89621.1 lactate utilization protein C [Sporosarcina sp. P21c]PIC92816.1 lactate utilization protein C [Sporosarcina sp. P25]
MTGSIQNRDAFLGTIATQLGREPMKKIEKPIWKHQPQRAVLADASIDELLGVLRVQCEQIHTDIVETTKESLPVALDEVVKAYGGGPLSLWRDERFGKYGLSHLVETKWPSEQIEVNSWDPSLGEKNIELAEQANIGITFSDMTLAESGTVVLFSSAEKGRSVSLLPTHYIALIPKSTLVPRITQASDMIREKLNNGEQVPSCINFITGPSNSADIEMNLVVGVHGPIKATYIVIDDC